MSLWILLFLLQKNLMKNQRSKNVSDRRGAAMSENNAQKETKTEKRDAQKTKKRIIHTVTLRSTVG